MRVEGWLSTLRNGQTTYTRRWVIIDGYILRTFVNEPNIFDDPAEFIMDLRAIESLKPASVYEPKGPCVLTAKGREAKTLTLAPAEHSTGIVFDEAAYAWWLPIIASAVPDRACAATIRGRYRKPEHVISLMTQHAKQQSAHQMSDAEWRRRQHQVKNQANNGSERKSSLLSSVFPWSRGSSVTSPRGSGTTPRGSGSSPRPDRTVSPRGIDIATRLQQAREREQQRDDTQASHREGDMASAPLASQIAEVDTPLAMKGGGVSCEQSEARAGASGRELLQGDSGSPQHKEQGLPSSGVDARVARTGCEEGGPTAVPNDAKAGGGAHAAEGGGWWFVRQGESVTGPHPAAEMRRRYMKGVINHSTQVRFLPLDERPAQDEYVGQPFAELQQLCSAAGPPFMERVPSSSCYSDYL